jgi:hypothetical protein
VTGFGLDVVTFEYRQVRYDKPSDTWEWADDNIRQATNLVYKYSDEDKKAIWNAPEGDKVVSINGPQPNHPEFTNQVTVVKLQPWERLSQIKVFSPKDKSYPLSGIELHFRSLKGGDLPPKLIGGSEFDSSVPNTVIGKADSEIIGMAIFFGHSLDALGVRSRELINEAK